jgi:hypothetical protein
MPIDAVDGDRPLKVGSDQRGSIIIVTVFAASFIIGLLFAMHGIGHAIHHGDAKRDAADAVAYSGAALHAHAMNEEVLLNLAKLTVLSVYTAAVTAESVGLPAISAYVAAMLAALQLQYIPQVPIAAEFGIELGEWLATNGPRLTRILRALEEAQDAVARDAYRMANLRVVLVARAFPDVSSGFLAQRDDLPLKPATANVTCMKIPIETLLQQFVVAFMRFQPDVAGIGLAASEAGYLPICEGLASGAGQAKEIQGQLGDEGFQVRGYSLGESLRTTEEGGVRVAAWQRNEGGGQITALRKALSQAGLAQAEFYYDGQGAQTGVHSDLLFKMNWHVRMRRYRDIDGFAKFGAGCTRAGGTSCFEIAVALQQGASLIIH